MKHLISHERTECIGCGACAAISDNWVIDEADGLARPLKTIITEEELISNKDAEQVCPVSIIRVEKIL